MDSARESIARAALCYAACPAAGPVAIGRETSPRIMRLRLIFARMVELHHVLAGAARGRQALRLRAELTRLTAEVAGISEMVWQSPLQGPVDVLERALVHHFHEQRAFRI